MVYFSFKLISEAYYGFHLGDDHFMDGHEKFHNGVPCLTIFFSGRRGWLTPQPPPTHSVRHRLIENIDNWTRFYKIHYFISNKYADISIFQSTVTVARNKVRMGGSGSLTPPQVNEVICITRLRTQHNH